MKRQICTYSFLVFKFFLLILTFFSPLTSLVSPTNAIAQEAKLTVRGSGLPVPRFVTLKFDEANLRSGPGREYPVLWQYRAIGLPLLVDSEFDIWRKVIDHEGTAGWMHGAVLSLKRMALVKNNMVEIHASPNQKSLVVALAERNALVVIKSCPKSWCKVASENVKGWINRQNLWGLLETEILD
ncbi:SH3 domain-containing protein [Candidatus Puniceispirillum sp.]|nr:SH3 domain-containing protein [Candidatus Puniceispirillum sp.]